MAKHFYLNPKSYELIYKNKIKHDNRNSAGKRPVSNYALMVTNERIGTRLKEVISIFFCFIPLSLISVLCLYVNQSVFRNKATTVYAQYQLKIVNGYLLSKKKT